MFQHHTLPDGTELTPTLQSTFRGYGDQLHKLGLLARHPQPYAATTANAMLDSAWDWLNAVLPPVHALKAYTALAGYLSLAQNHQEGSYLCHYCTDETFKGAEELYSSSGLAADLVRVLT